MKNKIKDFNQLILYIQLEHGDDKANEVREKVLRQVVDGSGSFDVSIDLEGEQRSLTFDSATGVRILDEVVSGR